MVCRFLLTFVGVALGMGFGLESCGVIGSLVFRDLFKEASMFVWKTRPDSTRMAGSERQT